MLDISVLINSNDFELFKKIIGKGIDSRLEGFTKSKFYKKGHRCYLDIDDSEIQILVRRLLEENTFEADLWAEDIIDYWYIKEE